MQKWYIFYKTKDLFKIRLNIKYCQYFYWWCVIFFLFVQQALLFRVSVCPEKDDEGEYGAAG